jgi:intron-binding protein aquarius
LFLLNCHKNLKKNSNFKIKIVLFNEPIIEEIKSTKMNTPTLSEIQNDKFSEIASKNWSKKTKFDSKIIENIYKELLNTNFDSKKIGILEYTHYLENYLWTNFNEKSTLAHVMSIVLIVNEKHRQNIPKWETFVSNQSLFSTFFEKFLTLFQEIKTIQEKNHFISFLIHSFQSFESEMLRNECFKLIGPQIWHILGENRRNSEFQKENGSKLKKMYEKKFSKSSTLEKNFMINLLNDFIQMVQLEKEGMKHTLLK